MGDYDQETSSAEDRGVGTFPITAEYQAIAAGVSGMTTLWDDSTEAMLRDCALAEEIHGRLQSSRNSPSLFRTDTGHLVHVKRLDRVRPPELLEVRGPEAELENEVAAYLVSRALDLGLVSPAVLREVPGDGGANTLASVRLFVPGQPRKAHEVPRAQAIDAAAFDRIIDHKDRFPRNWIFNEDANQLILIDNGWAFGYPRTEPARSQFHAMFEVQAERRRFDSGAPSRVQTALAGILDDSRIQAVIDRLKPFVE